MYRIVFVQSAEKDLSAFNKKIKPHIFVALFDLRKNPYSGKRLCGKFAHYFSLRVGNYRIIYRIYIKDRTIMMVRIGHRQGVYK